MFSQRIRRVSVPLTISLLVVGFALVMTGYLPAGIAGVVVLVFAIFVPFISLGIKPDPVN